MSVKIRFTPYMIIDFSLKAMSPTTDGPEWIYEYDWVSVYDVSTSKPTTKLTKINRFIPPLAKA